MIDNPVFRWALAIYAVCIMLMLLCTALLMAIRIYEEWRMLKGLDRGEMQLGGLPPVCCDSDADENRGQVKE